MKSIVSYLASDGQVHVYDTAQRRTPLCGEDVFVLGPADAKTRGMACEACCVAVLDAVEALGGR